MWIPQHHTYEKSTLVQVMTWCCQPMSHYLSQCWPRSISPYGVTRLQWVKYQRDLISLQTWPSPGVQCFRCWDSTLQQTISDLNVKLKEPDADVLPLPHLPDWHLVSLVSMVEVKGQSSVHLEIELYTSFWNVTLQAACEGKQILCSQAISLVSFSLIFKLDD